MSNSRVPPKMAVFGLQVALHEVAVISSRLKTVLTGATAVALVGCFLLFTRTNVPYHAGRPVSAWFDELCSGVFGGTPKAGGFDSAYAAFSQMKPDAVPYLTKQLRYDRSGIRQKILAFLRRHSIANRFATDFIWPPERRSYAAVALRQMGPSAEAAIPALLETWAHDAPDVKVNAVSALESILHGGSTDGASQGQWRTLESAVIADAARRYPRVAVELGIGLDQAQ
jgi:hypothetical protein